MKTAAALLRERDAISKASLKEETKRVLVADIDRQIEELAAQMSLPFKTGSDAGAAGGGVVGAPSAPGGGKSK